MNAHTTTTLNVNYQVPDEMKADAEEIPNALDIPATFTTFVNHAAQSKKERKLTLRELAILIQNTRAPTKAQLPWIKGARFGKVTTEKGSLRHDGNMLDCTCVEMDYDAEQISMDDMAAKFRAASIGVLLSTSPSATATKQRYRVHAALSAPCSPQERTRLAARLNGIAGGVFAEESFTLSQAFYYGGIEGNPAHRVILVDGWPVDLAPWLDKRAIGKRQKPAKPGETVQPAGPVDEAECLALIESGQSYTKPSGALLGSWARKGKMSAETAIKRLRAAMNKVPVEKQDARWRERFADLPRYVRSIFSKEEQARRVRNASETEYAFAQEFVARHRDTLKFYYPEESWYWFKPTGWQKAPKPAVINLSIKLIVELSPGNRKTNRLSTAAAVEGLARGEEGMIIRDEGFWDQNRKLLATPHGVIELTTGTLRPTRPDDYTTKVTFSSLPEGYDPDLGAELWCPRWAKFVDEVCQSDYGKMRFLKQWLGYCASGLIEAHKFVFIWGEGRNGKSVLQSAVSRMLGDYARFAGSDVFMASKYDRHTQEIWRLKGARLVCASETQEGRQWNTQRIKSIVAGDRQTARGMRQDDIEFDPECKLLFVGNSKPAIAVLDEAIKARIVMLHFNYKPHALNLKLIDELLAEGDGALAWIIEGFLDWQENGLTIPASVANETDEYFQSQDTFGLWLAECCERDASVWTSSDALWQSYSAYMTENHSAQLSTRLGRTTTFPARLAKSGFSAIRREGKRVWTGMRLVGELPDGG